MTTEISDVMVAEISILTTDAMPAVPAALMLLAKQDAATGTQATAPSAPYLSSAEVFGAALRKAQSVGEMRSLRANDPTGYSAYQARGEDLAANAHRKVDAQITQGSVSKGATQAFDHIVRDIARDRGVRLSVASRIARLESPEAFEAAFGG